MDRQLIYRVRVRIPNGGGAFLELFFEKHPTPEQIIEASIMNAQSELADKVRDGSYIVNTVAIWANA